ncbi:helix-turn-helix transcriptional regulator [Actinoplanes couchii]|uniref:Transcriptional regulator n=1 Tax=Actinoplanes couchii TaxID=403638 RepID=A0ABQ3XRX6_9ACTN|nr:LuxR family transcriptional regulator [Actinoplanes couchii]MDR6318721.1 DNA-binding CsgD family transcriptional regulator [Actinoplanes couchii]GID61249.1 transcriptional regulator [Actinoplanes couchii]
MIIGRAAELHRLTAGADPLLLVTGDLGSGRTTMLEHTIRAAKDAGTRVLRAVGSEAESVLPHAALHQLLRQSLSVVDPFAVGLAVLDALTLLQPVLIAVDDAQWIDRASLDALAFAGRRLSGTRVRIVIAHSGEPPVQGFPAVTLGPLDPRAAAQLLDRQPSAPTGPDRSEILTQADGNPLALIEFARTPAVLALGPLPVSERWHRHFAPRVAELTGRERETLLLAYANGERTGPAWAHHPLARSVVYHGTDPQERRAVHAALAATPGLEPDRRAWHLAAASPGPDATVSAALEQTADQARRKGGHAAKARALQHAAALAPEPAERVRLLIRAAQAAVATGDLIWVESLADAVREQTGDPHLLAQAALRVGMLAGMTNRHPVVFQRLVRAAVPLLDLDPVVAGDLLAAATVVRYQSGDDEQGRRLQALVSALGPTRPGLREWLAAVGDPHPVAGRGDLLAALPGPGEEGCALPESLSHSAVMAWLLDETSVAVRLFDEVAQRPPAHGSPVDCLGGAAPYAYLERGRWQQALDACDLVTATGNALGLDHAVATAAVAEATVLALRGRTDQARARVADGLALIDPLESRAVAVSARRALGTAAIADGDFAGAWEQLRGAFTADGSPVHYHVSFPLLADLAAAATHTGNHEEAARIVERNAPGMDSPRLQAILHRARGLLAGPEQAEKHLRAALADPTVRHWPFEYAQATLDLAEWLRRRRRITEARTPLTEALALFDRLGAIPWSDRTRAEARAAGLTTDHPRGPAAGPGAAVGEALNTLTPQQREVVRLAARGLSNREIGEHLYLSPRTVGSHLYRSFPKLGITTRTQLMSLEINSPGA